MLSTNVLCIKKRKKRSYCVANSSSDYNASTSDKSKRAISGTVAMLHITEDTPPDMLAGAMDLTVHLPTGRAVKMSVERSTPMMDLLVQVTTNHHLQLSNYTLQALGMAPSVDYSDKILPYKPNTPIGALDTQHIKVIPKSRTLPVPKNVPLGHQPFESTFRLKVHLPRNQLYVTRVSQSVYLEDIMRKVCEEKNLDPMKYEFRHPGNLDEILDPKLTLSDYQITEVYVVLKGTVSLNQTFSTTDIMALRKEEERKQMHNKTGGGVFNLIFRRGKSSNGSGSLSSENRSISPTQSDDSRSVTPPAVQQQIITPRQPEPPPERPKPPQRKRRPAPKPPQQQQKVEEEKAPIKAEVEVQQKKIENGLTICHSRNSSDSSGYHEASILSDNCNTSLPRRPKSTMVHSEDNQKLSGVLSQSTSNLSKMSSHSKSTSSLALPSRKKKTAPAPPPPVLKSASSVTKLDKPSPLIASQPIIKNEPEPNKQMQERISITNPTPAPRHAHKVAPIPHPRSHIACTKVVGEIITNKEDPKTDDITLIDNTTNKEGDEGVNLTETDSNKSTDQGDSGIVEDFDQNIKQNHTKIIQLQKQNINDIFNSNKFATSPNCESERRPPEIIALIPKATNKGSYSKSMFDSYTRKRGFQIGTSLLDHSTDDESVISVISTDSDSVNKKSSADLSSLTSVTSALNSFNFVDEIDDVDVDLFTGSISKNSKSKTILNQLHGMHDFERNGDGDDGFSSLRSIESVPGFMGNSNMKKWNNSQELDDISMQSGCGLNKWVNNGDTSDTETTTSIQYSASDDLDPVPAYNPPSPPKNSETLNNPDTEENKVITPTDVISTETGSETKETFPEILDLPSPNQSTPPETVTQPNDIKEDNSVKDLELNELESDWQYQLPSPPKAFRDSSPTVFTETVRYETETVTDFKTDSVVTSPELFEKLKIIKDNQSEERETVVSEIPSVLSEEEKPLLNKLSLENLEKRKSLVYNRELATSLKMTDIETKNDKMETFSSTLTKFERTYEEIRRSSLQNEEYTKKIVATAATQSTLPNFKITTYDNPKQKLNIFEDDTVRSNSETNSKRNSVIETAKVVDEGLIHLRKHSLDNIHSDDELGKRNNYKFYRPQSAFMPKMNFGSNTNVYRSESFSTDQTVWSPTKPVTRSKSQIALNKYKDEKSFNQQTEDNLAKSNSLFDVSGLQSLGVIRLIQNRLNTPTNSTEDLNKKGNTHQKNKPSPELPPSSTVVLNNSPPEDKQTIKRYQYRGVPSINMSTWSERPKVPVNVKEDPDYKFSNGKESSVQSKLIVNTTSNDIKSNNSVIEVKNNSTTKLINTNHSFNNNNNNTTNVRISQPDSRNVSIKVNGSEPISTQNTGNVVIKIGNTNSVIHNNQTNEESFRKPLGNINKIEHNQRPHSIAFGSDFDISRVPIVRSVEFKKPFKDFQNNNNNNTSVTQIYQDNNPPKNNYHHKGNIFSRNSFNTNETDLLRSKFDNSNTEMNKKIETQPKPVFRVNSYLQNSVPVVRGFRANDKITHWNQPNSFSTLPPKSNLMNYKEPQPSYTTNKDVPFSQSNLRRTESTKVLSDNVNSRNQLNSLINSTKKCPVFIQPPPPPPPLKNSGTIQMNNNNKVNETNFGGDPKEKLLQAIRDFGGKKGLRAVKA